MEIDTGVIRQLTNKASNSDSSPKFSPDGRSVIFLSTNRGSAVAPQLFQVPLNGDESQVVALTNYNVPIDGFKISKAQNNQFFIAFSAQIYLDCKSRADQFTCSKKFNDGWASQGSNTGYAFNKLFVRHWDSYVIEGKVSHVFLQKISASNGLRLVGDAFDTMFQMNADAPIPPFGGEEQYDISMNGNYIALNIDINDERVAWTTGWKIFVAKVNWGSDSSPISSETPKLITGFTQARTQNPSFSPFQEEVLAYLAMNTPGYESDNLHINVYNLFTDKTNQTVQPASLDRSIGELTWYDAKNVVIAYSDDGCHVLSLLDISSPNGTLIPITADGHSASPVKVPNSETIVFVRDSLISPADIYVARRLSLTFTTKQITNYNRDFVAKFELSKPEKTHFIGAKSQSVQAWVIRPVNFDPSKKYPVANLVHGGPEGAFEDSWSYRWNPQLWTSAGYVVIMINFHGSDGWGLEFKKSILGNWGSYPYEDITTGTDYLTSRYSFMDANRVCALGASYGGYSMNWLLGHNENNRYKCIVTHDGLSDLQAAYYSTDELWFPETEFGSTPWANPEGYQRYNPINHVTKWKTPTLVIHGGKDFRLPIAQGLTVFTALQRQGVPSKMLVFPEENHWVLKPQNSIMWYDNVLDWLKTWIGNAPSQ